MQRAGYVAQPKADRRLCAANPTKANPTIIIAQVEGSGTDVKKILSVKVPEASIASLLPIVTARIKSLLPLPARPEKSARLALPENAAETVGV